MATMKNTGFFILILFVAIVFVSVVFFSSNSIPNYSQNTSISCNNCNVILISIDTLRADHLGVYGYDKNTSPNIDEFARESVMFKNFYSEVTFTPPSHASIFTGLYPFNHQAYNVINSGVFNNSETLPQILKSHNYTTIAVVGSAVNATLPPLIFAKMFDLYVAKRYISVNETIIRAKDWIDVNQDKKFFLFWHIYDAHCPYMQEDETYCNQSKKNNATQDQALQQVVYYDQSISYVDNYVSDFLNYLKEGGLYNNTIVIITSDHGEEFAEHGFYQHSNGPPNFEQVYVPFIIHIPNFESKVIYSQAQSVDIMPTVLDILNITAPSRIDGHSLTRTILNSSENADNYTYSEWNDNIAFRTQSWEIIITKNQTHLYNLTTDRSEKNDLSMSNSDLTNQMKNDYAVWISNNTRTIGTNPDLIKIGYVN